jgi:hypothetical protein
MSITVGSSLPSLPVTSIDLPEIKEFNYDFVYNFFTTDELTNANITTLADPNTVEFSKNVPRYVKLSWSKVIVASAEKARIDFIGISIQKNAAKVIDEEDFYVKVFSNFQQQETNFVTQTQSYMSRLYEQLNYNRRNASLNDAYKAIHESTPELLSQEFISKYLNYAQSNATRTSQESSSPIDDMQMKNIVVPVIKKIYGTMLHEKLLNDSLTPLNKNIIDAVAQKFEDQVSVRDYANRFNGSQYDLTLETPVSTKVEDVNTNNNFAYETTGYIIDRYRLQNSSLVEKKTFYIENPETNELFDTEILYNQKYVYNIKVVTAIQTLAFDPEQKINFVGTYLVAGKVMRTVANCVDENPAQPPTDFFIQWDYSLKKLVLSWNFPNDIRRHIKYFQVFRRKNVGPVRPAQLPFELVKMYDFNDLQQASGVIYNIAGNVFKFVNGEDAIDMSVVTRVNDLKNLSVVTPTCFIDEEFNKEDYYIYAVAAVDAHGITTNYSNQIGVKFNMQRNTIGRVDISEPGAPKPYPNLYLNKDTFIDTIKNEGYSQVTVVFNPEYIDLQRQSGEDLNILRYGPDNFYRLQLINTDLQQDQFIDIKITDERTTV